MVDPVEAGLDIAFENPSWSDTSGQRVEALFDCIRARSRLPKPVRVPVGPSFRDWVKSEQVECLHGPVLHRGDPEGSFLPVRLWDIQTPKRKRLIAASPQIVYSLPLAARRGPHFPVHAGSPLSSILRHPLDGKRLAAKRVGEPVVQGAL